MYHMLMGQDKGLRHSGTGVPDGCELTQECWELVSSPLQEPQVLFNGGENSPALSNKWNFNNKIKM